MLRLFPYNAVSFKNGQIAFLEDAVNVKTSWEINGEYMLDFEYPYTEKSEEIKENRIVVCEGQAYRIMRVAHEDDGTSLMRVNCLHVFCADARGVHIQNFGGTKDTIGANPYKIMELAFSGTRFSLFSESELEALGMNALGADGFLIDFESVDKTNPYDIVQQIIINSGKGEIYIDNYKVALVEKIGTDKGVKLEISKNLQNVTIERDITNMGTRLYPYGKDDAHIGSVNNNIQYIDSLNAGLYGVREGYRDYSDYSEPSDILAHAQWEFDPDNEERIDVPEINISGEFIDLSKLSDGDLYSISLGDKITVIDKGNHISERIIRLERYPFEPNATNISIGRVKKDLFFYLKQMGLTTKRSNKISTSNGKVSAKSIAGTVNAASAQTAANSNRVTASSGSATASVYDAMIEVKNGSYIKCRIGNSGGKFVFDVYDNKSVPEKALCIADGGLSVVADSIEIGGMVLGVKDNGLSVNDKKILTSE